MLDNILVQALQLIVNLACIIVINVQVQRLVRNAMNQLMYGIIKKKLVYRFVKMMENILVPQAKNAKNVK